MRNIVVALSVISACLLFGIIYLYTAKISSRSLPLTTVPTATKNPTPSLTTVEETGSMVSFCKPSDLQAIVVLEGAAGNIFGALTIKNISVQNCQIAASNFIAPKYTASNILVTHVGQSGPTALTMAPGQTLYSQVHYPNGPQCQGPTQQVKISFTYPISISDMISFKDQNGNTYQTIQVCTSSTNTDVQVWSISQTQTSG